MQKWRDLLVHCLAGPSRGHGKTTITTARAAKSKQKTVIYDDFGGAFGIYFNRFKALKATGNDVEIRGACISGCTLITILIPSKQLCFDKNAWLGFHHAFRADGVVDEDSIQLTELIFDSYPP